MNPDEAARLRRGDRVYVLPDSMLPGVKAGIFTVLGTRETVIGGKRSVRVKIADGPEVWAWPHHLGRVSSRQ